MAQDKTIIRAPSKPLALKGCGGAHVGKTYPIKQELKVGREQDNDLIISEGFVSRHHATLRFISGVLSVTDSDSANGTYVNGEPVRTALLSEGDKVTFDTVEFVVVEHTPEANADTMSAAEIEQQKKLKIEQERVAAQIVAQQQAVAQQKAAEAALAAEQATKEQLAQEQAAKEDAEYARLEKIKLQQQLAVEKSTSEQALMERSAQQRAVEQAQSDRLAKAELDDVEKTVFSPAVTLVATDTNKTAEHNTAAGHHTAHPLESGERTLFTQAAIKPVAADKDQTMVAPRVSQDSEKTLVFSPGVESQGGETAAIGQSAVNKIKSAAAENPTEVELLGVTEPVLERKFTLNKNIITVGRSPFNDIILKSASVSSQHAELEKIDGRWWVRDLGSSNGTFVNDQPVDECELYSDDSLIFGEVELTFDHDGFMPAPEGREINCLETERGSPLLLWGVGAVVVIAVIVAAVLLI